MAVPARASRARPRDLLLVRRAYRCARLAGHRPQAGLRIVLEARRNDIPISAAFAVVEQESAFRNIFGHDQGGPMPGMAVTAARVRALIRSGHSNGIGLTQLTYPPLVLQAQRDGGAHKTSVQVATGMDLLGGLLHAEKGNLERALARYNAGSVNAKGRAYAAQVMPRYRRYHRALTPRRHR